VAYEQAAHELIALSLMTSSNVQTLSFFYKNAVFYAGEASGYVRPLEF
jgi:hypothetical protein